MAVTLTEAAARHVNRYLAKRGQGVGVRLGVKTTGCSGLAYKLEYVDEISPEDKMCIRDSSVTLQKLIDDQLAKGLQLEDQPSMKRAIAPMPVSKLSRVNAPNSVFALGNAFTKL